MVRIDKLKRWEKNNLTNVDYMFQYKFFVHVLKRNKSSNLHQVILKNVFVIKLLVLRFTVTKQIILLIKIERLININDFSKNS